MLNQEESYWTTRYKEHSTGWDIGYPSTPIKSYIDQLENKDIKLLIPGAGNGYEAEYLIQQGFTNVHILDISKIPLQEFKKRNPTFPDSHLHHGNFFDFKGAFDLILEQTFFCSFVPTDQNRSAYAKQMASLLKENGKLVGLWFSIPLTDDLEKRPFGGDKELYLTYLNPYFNSKTFQSSYNSILPRQNRELFGIFIKK
ncbi:methyltransferase domain-containing protein [Cellulophaga sp. L1A9]|uniref:methyltransferase domain-containing protein n=1 Tax=Cellulophaga sp. L1A9 TaxID=2686362 RepID=UPI00131B3710|nr:methyltransferase domain-containing protein [Cellulophaga sp. L1A9]